MSLNYPLPFLLQELCMLHILYRSTTRTHRTHYRHHLFHDKPLKHQVVFCLMTWTKSVVFALKALQRTCNFRHLQTSIHESTLFFCWKPQCINPCIPLGIYHSKRHSRPYWSCLLRYQIPEAL